MLERSAEQVIPNTLLLGHLVDCLSTCQAGKAGIAAVYNIQKSYHISPFDRYSFDVLDRARESVNLAHSNVARDDGVRDSVKAVMKEVHIGPTDLAQDGSEEEGAWFHVVEAKARSAKGKGSISLHQHTLGIHILGLGKLCHRHGSSELSSLVMMTTTKKYGITISGPSHSHLGARRYLAPSHT